LSRESVQGPLVREIETISGQRLLDCYQCGRCTSGCPLVEEMDILPNQVIRLAQLGLRDVLEARAPWVCAACLTCQARCPKGVDLPRVMEALRQIAQRQGPIRLEAVRISPELLEHAPQMAVVGALRKAGK
jgi:heterodisulfide reductase subunit C